MHPNKARRSRRFACQKKRRDGGLAEGDPTAPSPCAPRTSVASSAAPTCPRTLANDRPDPHTVCTPVSWYYENVTWAESGGTITGLIHHKQNRKSIDQFRNHTLTSQLMLSKAIRYVICIHKSPDPSHPARNSAASVPEQLDKCPFHPPFLHPDIHPTNKTPKVLQQQDAEKKPSKTRDARYGSSVSDYIYLYRSSAARTKVTRRGVLAYKPGNR